MADHRCWRCKFHQDIGPRDVRGQVRCVPNMKIGGPPPVWVKWAPEDADKWRDLSEGETRCGENCARFVALMPRESAKRFVNAAEDQDDDR